MDWDWIKAFPQSLKDEFKSMKITVNWQKHGPPFYRFPRWFAAAVDCRADPLASGLAESVSTKLASAVGSCVTTASSTHQKRSYRPDPCAAGVPDYSRGWPDSVDHAAQHQRTAMVVQQKLAIFWLVFGLCWKVLEKTALPYVTSACRNSRPATGVGKLSASVSHCCLSISGLWWQNFPRCI